MFELANPWFLCCLPLPLLYWLLMPVAKTRAMLGLKVPFYAVLQQLSQQEQSRWIASASLWIPAFVWCLLVGALAGPRWIGNPVPVQRESYNLMMALDLSGSMALSDMVLHQRPVSRLTVVKQAAARFVEARKGDRIGLILFGSQAYLQTPLTYDRHSVLMRIDDATVGLAGKTTSIGDAVGLAVKRLSDMPRHGRVIVLLTDGANNSGVLSPVKAAELARDDGIKIYTIGLGAEPGMTPDMLDYSSADLDENTLKEMAKITGGQYFRATDPHSLNAIYQTINQLERIKQEQATLRPQKEYYPWGVVLALGIIFIWLGWLLSRERA